MTMPIPMEMRQIGNELHHVINARLIHRDLEVHTRYNDWFRARVEQFGFNENGDYTTVTENLVSGGSQKTHYVSLDMAKELAMVERNEKGRAIRRYFIECEKKLKDAGPILPVTHAKFIIKETLEVGSLLKVPMHLLQTEAVRTAYITTGHDFTPLLAHASAQQHVEEDERMLEVTEIGKKFLVNGKKLTGKRVNDILEAWGYQYWDGQEWWPTDLGKPYAHRKPWNNRWKQGYNLWWNVEFACQVIEDYLAEHRAN